MSRDARRRVNVNGCVVIPASFRKELGIKAPDEVILRIEDNELRISTLKHRIERAQRLIRERTKPGKSVVNELIREQHKAARNE
jgi:AbrB family looped-hinge helix DNA binding protein